MKALVWTNPRELQLQTIEKPSPASGEVILRVRYAGICGSDLSGYLGENSLRKPPLIMGHEFTGEVDEIGDRVEGLKKGDLVAVNPLVSCGSCRVCKKGFPQYCSHRSIIGIHQPGAYAEFVKVPAANCFQVADALSGSLIEPIACGVRAARQAKIQLGDCTVVFGAGIIGLLSMKIAQLMGSTARILVDTNEDRLNLGKVWGATHTVNPKYEDVVKVIQEISNGGVDKVIDAVGLPITRKQGIEVLTDGGRIVFIGLHEDDSTLPGNVIVRKEIEIAGSFCYSDDDFFLAISLIEQKVIQPHSSWLDVRTLGEGKRSFDEQINGPAIYPKIVLSV